MSPSGRLRTVWTYNSDYYTFDLPPKRFQLLIISFIVIPALIVLVWIGSSLIPSTGRDTVLYVGGFWYFSLIPMVYMILGAIGAFKMKPEMTYRDLYSCYRRIKVASWGLPVFYLLSIIGDIVFVSIYNEYFSLQPELPWLCGAFLLFLLSLSLFIIQAKVRKKIVVVEKQTTDCP